MNEVTSAKKGGWLRNTAFNIVFVLVALAIIWNSLTGVFPQISSYHAKISSAVANRNFRNVIIFNFLDNSYQAMLLSEFYLQSNAPGRAREVANYGLYLADQSGQKEDDVVKRLKAISGR